MGHIMIFSSRTFSLVTSQDILSVGLFVYDPQKRKSTQLKDFRHFFIKKLYQCPRNVKKGFAKNFVLAKTYTTIREKACVCVVVLDYADTVSTSR